MSAITISAETIPDWHERNRNIELRIFAESDFLTSDDIEVLSGSPQEQTNYQAVPCSVNLFSSTLTISSFAINSTTDAREGADRARYFAFFYTTSGKLIKVFDNVAQGFAVPASPSLTTWADIIAYNRVGYPNADFSAFTKAETQRLLDAISSQIGTVNNPIVHSALTAALPTAAGALSRALDGIRALYVGNGSRAVPLFGGRVNVQLDFEAKGDGIVASGSMTAGSNVFTASTPVFTSTAVDGGKAVDVSSAGVQTELVAIIVARNSSTSITISTAASFTLSGQTLAFRGTTFSDCATMAGETEVTSATANFAASDVGRVITITSAGRYNKVGAVITVINPTTCTLSFTASGDVVNKPIVFGTDDGDAIRAAHAAAVAAGVGLYFPKAKYICSSFVSSGGGFDLDVVLAITAQDMVFSGDGPYASCLYTIGPLGSTSASNATVFQVLAGAATLKFDGLGFFGTNAFAQTPSSGSGASDGLLIDNTGDIGDVVINNCAFDNAWLIGFHSLNPNRQGSLTIQNSFANWNGFDGFNPSAEFNSLTMTNNRADYNGTGGIEALGGPMVLIANKCKHNRGVGISLGGFGDPVIDYGNAILGNTCEYNFQGIVAGSNLQGMLIEANIMQFNDLSGITMQNNFGTLHRYNRVISNIVINNGTGIILSNVDYIDVEGNYLRDIGVTGFPQSIGISMANTNTNINILRNNCKGHSTDYAASDLSSFYFLDEFGGTTGFGSATVIYVDLQVQNFKLNGSETHVPQTLSTLSGFDPLGMRIGNYSMNGTASDNIGPQNGYVGQRLTLNIFDASGGRFIGLSSFRGGTNVTTVANKYTVVEFQYHATIGWTVISQNTNI